MASRMQEKTAEALFAEALEAGRKRDYHRAETLLQGVLLRTDRIPEALLFLGRCYHALGEFERSLQSLSFYARRKPDSPVAHFFLGRTYLSLGMHRRAAAHLKAAADRKPGSPAILGLLALASLKSGRCRLAVHYFQQALEASPGNPRILNAYYNALLAYGVRAYQHGALEQSREAFTVLAENRPESLITRLYLAALCRDMGETNEALEHLEEATRLQPGDPILYMQKAHLHLLREEPQAAAFEMQRAMQLLGRSGGKVESPRELLRLMAMIHFGNHRYRQAIDCGRRVLREEAGDPQMHAIMAESFRGLGDLEKARNHYLRALESDRQRREYMHGLISVLWDCGDHRELESRLLRMLEADPSDQVAAYYHALNLPWLGQPPEQTIPLIQEQIHRFGPEIHLMNALGQEYLKAGLEDLAEGWFQRTLKRDPGHSGAMRSLIEVFKRLGKDRELKNACSSYLDKHPEDREVRRFFSLHLFQRNAYREASQQILKLLPYEAQKAHWKKMLAVCYRKMRKFAEATILFRELLAANPSSLELLRSLVYCLEETHQRRSAITLLEKANRHFKDELAVMLPLGVMYVKENELEKAGEIFRKIVSSSPREWKAYHNLATVYRKTGNEEFARRFLKKAEELRRTG